MFATACGVLGLAALAGCATRQSGLSASDQTARYLQGARGRYAIPGSAGDPWGPYIREASNRYDIPDTWIRALMRQESGGNLYRSGRLITSSAGAMGLMQVMPGTYAELRARHSLGSDPFDPHDNIMAGVAYMREMYDMYGSPGFLAAYNAGPNRLDDYLANQRGLPDETRKYVAAIGPSLRHASPRVRSPAEQFAMNQLPLYIPPGPRYGYGTALPTVQLASVGPSYSPPASAYVSAPVARPVAFPAATPTPAVMPQPTARAVAWAEPPRPVYTPAPSSFTPAPATALVQSAPRAVAWAEPPRPIFTPAPVPAPAPVQRTIITYVDEPAPPAPAPRARFASVLPRAYAAQPRLTLASVPPPPPAQQRRGGFHLISTAVAAEVYPVRHATRGHAIQASYARPAQVHAGAPQWRLRASGPVQAAPGCSTHGKGKGCGHSHRR